MVYEYSYSYLMSWSSRIEVSCGKLQRQLESKGWPEDLTTKIGTRKVGFLFIVGDSYGNVTRYSYSTFGSLSGVKLESHESILTTIGYHLTKKYRYWNFGPHYDIPKCPEHLV